MCCIVIKNKGSAFFPLPDSASICNRCISAVLLFFVKYSIFFPNSSSSINTGAFSHMPVTMFNIERASRISATLPRMVAFSTVFMAPRRSDAVEKCVFLYLLPKRFRAPRSSARITDAATGSDCEIIVHRMNPSFSRSRLV